MQKGRKKGYKVTEESKRKISLAMTGRDGMKEEKNPRWKGDNCCYAVIHQWVARWKGSPHICEGCGNTKLRHRQYHWANIDGKYRRVLDDYIRMCVKCHSQHDKLLRKNINNK